MKKTFTFWIVMLASAYIVFVVVYGSYVQEEEQKRLNIHSKVIATAVWDFNAEGIAEYLSLACKAYNYGRIVVTQDTGEIFADLSNSLQSPLDKFLFSLNLIPTFGLTSDVVYDGKVIGRITATWYNTAIYIYFYVLILCFLAGTVMWYYLHTITAKHELEARVEERTANLLEEITERKLAEEALQKSQAQLSDAMEIAKLGYWEYDVSSNLFIFNDHFYSIFRTSADKVGGYTMTPDRYAEMFLHQEDRPSVEAETRKAIETADPNYSRQIEHRIIYADGEPGYIAVRFFIVKDDQGRTIKTFGANQDITERKQAENEKKELESQLRQAMKMEAIGTLAGGIAHDFNNILGAIMGYTELSQLDAPKGSQLESHLGEVFNATRRAKDLVQQILTFSRQSEKKLKPTKIRLIVQEALKLLRASLPATIEIHQNVKSDGLVMADPTQIHQVMMNLGTNAGHAMEEEGGVLDVSLVDLELDADFVIRHPDMQPGPFLQLTVNDTGKGMPPEVLSRIFDPFYSTKEAGEGTGLGLSVVHGIVKSHGGTIYAYSEPGRGSSFKVYLPAIERRFVQEEREEKPLPKGTEQILFIDDEEALVDIGKRMLDSLGYEVTTRMSSLEALKLFTAYPERFDLVITDQTMPGMTGDQLAEELIAVRSTIPIILCTGFSTRMSEEKAFEIGIRGFIMKPLIMHQLAETIRNILDATG